MGVTRFESVVANTTVGTADVDKLAASFDKLSSSIENSGKRADTVAQHPGFDAFAEKVKQGIEDPLGAAGSAVEGLLKSLGPLGTGVAGGAAILGVGAQQAMGFARELGNLGDGIQDTAARMGLTTRETQEVAFAMKYAGGEMGSLEGVMRKLSTEVEGGGANLHKMGIQFHDVTTGEMRPTLDILLQLSDRWGKETEAKKRNAEATSVLGRSALGVLPDLLRLRQGMERSNGEKIFSDEDLAQFQHMQQEMAVVDRDWEYLKNRLKQPLAASVVISIPKAELLMKLLALPLNAAGQLTVGKGNATDQEMGETGGYGYGASMSRAAHEAEARSVAYNNSLVAAARVATDEEKFTAAKKQLEDLRNSLKTDVLPSVNTGTLGDIAKQADLVKGLEARIKATTQLTEDTKALDALTARMNEKVLDPGSKMVAEFFDKTKNSKLDPEKVQAGFEAMLNAVNQELLDREDEVAEKRDTNLAKSADFWRKAWQSIGDDAADASTRAVAAFVKTSEEVRQIGEKALVQRTGQDAQNRLTFLGYATMPGQEGLASTAALKERLDAADQIYKIEVAAASKALTLDEQRKANATAYAQLKETQYQAEIEHEMEIGALQRRRVEEFRGEMAGLFDALTGGRSGVSQWILGEAKNLGRAAFSNTLTQLKTGGDLKRNTIFGGTWLADPTKDLAGGKLSAAGNDLHVAALSLQDAARVLALSRTGGGGTFRSVWDSIPRSGGGSGATFSSVWDSIPYSSGPAGFDYGSDADGSSWEANLASAAGSGGVPSGMTLGRGLALGGAALGGGFGLYAGIRQGGARGALTAAGSVTAAAGGILSLVSKSLGAWAGPAGMIAGAVLGTVIPSLLGDPKKERDQAEADRLTAARYTASVSANYTVDRYGRQIDYDQSGGMRVYVTVPVQAIDTADFADRAPVIVGMLTEAIEGQNARLAAALRNTVRPR